MDKLAVITINHNHGEMIKAIDPSMSRASGFIYGICDQQYSGHNNEDLVGEHLP